MRIHQLFGREPQVLIQYAFDPTLNGYVAVVSTFTLFGANDFVAAVGLDQLVDRAADIASFLAPWADLEPLHVRELERDRVLASRSPILTR